MARRAPPGVPPTLVVMHCTAQGESGPESTETALGILRERGLSYHYIIAKSGGVVECLPPSMKAYHAGSSYGPKEQVQNLPTEQEDDGMYLAKTSVNPYSIGISFVNLNDGVDPYTKEQTESAVALILQLRELFPTLETITGHADVSPRRKSDPLGYDLAALAKLTGLGVWSRNPSN